jgi:TfoX/Sxy family transcriptional regulator of competence genes
VAYDERTAERIRHLLAERHDVAEKKMMGGLAFMVKGGMCCAVSGRGGLLVRVGPDAAMLVKEPDVKPMRMAGRIVRNFIRVMPEAYRTPAQLKKWIDRGVAFTTTLPPKTKRPRSK